MENIRKKYFYYAATILIILVLLFSMVLRNMGDNREFACQGFRVIRIAEGMTTAGIADMLHERQLVKNTSAFRLEARLMGLAEKLQAGVYQLEGGLSNREIVDVLSKGKVQFLSFTLPEGFTIVRAAEKIEREGLGSAKKFMAAAKRYAPYYYMQTNNPNVRYMAEGFIFPATYELPADITEAQLLEKMVEQFNSELEKENIFKGARRMMMPVRDVINIAAMVEQEAVFPEEQPRIAGIFLKRLEIGMPIQSDTTVQYILGGKQRDIITFKDTEIEDPYNTYQNIGLPPGPIACPGMKAIKSVINPERTDYLYFVAEKDGHHRFSTTYIEHQQAIYEINEEK
ncbi:MAG: endolytic transglycosylase MltG [Phascolarctobacterium sp.]|nr:endolytic transglycosylase MltG [Phascolarctobacterium sp.]